MPHTPPPPRNGLPLGLGLTVIGVTLTVISLAFAYLAGWLSPRRLDAAALIDAVQINNGGVFPGYRRGHAKGICFSGHFASNGQGAGLSSAPLFANGQTPVIGRFATGSGNPYTPDAKSSVRSMALSFQLSDGQVWRTAMNSVPFQLVGTPEDFYQSLLANRLDPATGKPDPAKQAAFNAAHAEQLKRFNAAMANWPLTDSYASTPYNSVNAFQFIDAHGNSHPVRWSMQPQTETIARDKATLERLPADFLIGELQQRLQQGPLRFDMRVTEAQPGDPIDDASQPWPSERISTNVGTLVIERAIAQADGPCRDINFDPLILPSGIRPSADPLLAARGAAYSISFNRRMREQATQGIAAPHNEGGQP